MLSIARPGHVPDARVCAPCQGAAGVAARRDWGPSASGSSRRPWAITWSTRRPTSSTASRSHATGSTGSMTAGSSLTAMALGDQCFASSFPSGVDARVGLWGGSFTQAPRTPGQAMHSEAVRTADRLRSHLFSPRTRIGSPVDGCPAGQLAGFRRKFGCGQKGFRVRVNAG